MEEITYQGETYRPITRDGMYLATQDGKVLSLQCGKKHILKIVNINGKMRIVLKIDGRRRQFTPMRIKYAAQNGMFAVDVPNITYVEDKGGRVIAKEEQTLPDVMSFLDQEFFLIPGEKWYYATKEGKLLSFKKGRPILSKGFCKDGKTQYMIRDSSMKRHVSVSSLRIAYSIQTGIPLKDLSGVAVTRGRDGKLVTWKVKQYRRMAAGMMSKKKIVNPHECIRRMKEEIRLFEIFYQTRNIVPLKQYAERMKDKLTGYVVNRYGFNHTKAEDYARSAIDTFLAGVALKRYITSNILYYLLSIIRNCHNKELEMKKVKYDDNLCHDVPESLDEWE